MELQFHHDHWFWRIVVIDGLAPSNDPEAEHLVEFDDPAIAGPMVGDNTSESIAAGIRNLPGFQQMTEPLALKPRQDARR